MQSKFIQIMGMSRGGFREVIHHPLMISCLHSLVHPTRAPTCNTTLPLSVLRPLTFYTALLSRSPVRNGKQHNMYSQLTYAYVPAGHRSLEEQLPEQLSSTCFPESYPQVAPFVLFDLPSQQAYWLLGLGFVWSYIFFVDGRDHPAADQPNNLAEGHPPP